MAPSNSDEFDGYRKWLGITDKNRLPTHYELLAISLDEDDLDVIRAAVEQRRQYVESKRGHGHDDVVAEILYRICEAEGTLLNDEMRRDYDRAMSLFEKRRKNRRVDPNAPRTRFTSRPGRAVGEDGGTVKTFVGIMAVVCIGFGGMAWLSFQLPWFKKPKEVEVAPALLQQPIITQPVQPPQPVLQPPAVQAPKAVIVETPKPVQVQPSWMPLVKGNDLTGWTGFTKGFYIDESVLVMQNTKPSERGDIYTDAEFGDFILRYDFQLPLDANSGITPRFRSDDSHNIKINIVGKDFKLVAKNGTQIETDPKNNQVGVIVPSGYKAPYVFPDPPVILPPPSWNQMEVSAIGNKLTIAVNGARILDRSFDEFAVEAADKEAWKRRTKGKIGIGNFTGTVRFRDIKIQEIRPDANQIAPIEVEITTQPVVQNENLIGATLYQGHNYKVFREALDWKTAKSRCEAMGGHLVTISNEQENKFITALATKTLGDINNSGIWLGATDERNEGQWQWLDGTQFNYSAWFEGQPNGKNKENYLLLLLYSRGPAGKEFRGWCDQPNEGKIHVTYYACEWDSIDNPVKPVEPEKPKDPIAEAMQALQGDWKCVVLQQNGSSGLTIKDEKLKSQDRQVTFKGNIFELMRTRDGNRNGYTGKVMINPQNGHFDFIGKGTAGAINEWIGIYSVEGETLKLCYRVKNNDKAVRPTEFKTDSSDEANTMIFEKYERN